jgi:hypothetical protein
MNAAVCASLPSTECFIRLSQKSTIAQLALERQIRLRDFDFWASVTFACAALLPSKKCGFRAQPASTETAFFSAGRSPLGNTIRISLSNASVFTLGAVGV